MFLAVFLCDFIACDDSYMCKVQLVKRGRRNLMRSGVLSSVLLTFPFFWDAALCHWASGVPQCEGSQCCQNTRNYFPNDTLSRSRRLVSSGMKLATN
jgi:hypothetical protein